MSSILTKSSRVLMSKANSTLTPVFAAGGAPPAAPYSPGMKVGNLLYLSGQVPMTADGKMVEGSITEKTKQVFKNLETLLSAGNSALDKVVKVNIFLTDMADFKEFNAIYGKYFTTHKPARSCVAVKELPLGAEVEIELIALVEEGTSKI